MKKTTQRPRARECTHHLTTIVDPAKLDTRPIAATRKRLLAVGVRLLLIAHDGSSLSKVTGG